MIGRKIQNYKVLSLLGEGGMGTVYKVLDTQLERFAALKIINLNSLHNSSFAERFKREARNQAKLSHPNIVSVYGFVQEKDILGIAMEYVEGDTIESIIKNRGRIEICYAVELMEQILNGIESAHNQGFIHRDLKPSNIILDLNGNPKIMDFGISKSIDELKTITQHNARPGTLLYMSPEQLGGNTITIKSDLYALGITFYEMLTGFHPYNATTIYEIIDSHVNQIPERISSKIDSIPILTDEIILSAMNKSNYSNFNTAKDFRMALDGLKKIQSNNPSEYFVENIIQPEDETIKLIKPTKNFTRISNILLLILFLGLGIIVFNVVKSILSENKDKTDTEALSYTQDYSKNPNYSNSTNWIINKVPTSNNLKSICFIDDYNGYIVGDSGTVLQTNDGGINWKKNSVTFSNNFNSAIYNDERIFIVGSSGFVGYITTNSKQLNKIDVPTTESLFKIYFVNNNTGFIVGSNGIILKTDDGGLTWNKKPNNISENLFSINFADKKNGIIAGWNSTILKTSDEGNSWYQNKVNFSTYLKDILFVNEFLGFIVGGEGLILRTENGGDDWDEVTIDSESGLYKISFDTNGEGIILSNSGEIFISNDAGKNWKKSFIGEPIILNDVQKLNSGNFIAVGNNGNIVQSRINSK